MEAGARGQTVGHWSCGHEGTRTPDRQRGTCAGTQTGGISALANADGSNTLNVGQEIMSLGGTNVTVAATAEREPGWTNAVCGVYIQREPIHGNYVTDFLATS